MTSAWTSLVVGCGAVGSGYDERRPDGPSLTHAGAYVTHERTRLIGGVDPDPAARLRFEQRWGLGCDDDLDSALAARPEIVSICTPPGDRLSIVRRVLAAAPRAIWCEKPLAETSAEAEEIRRLCEAAGVALQVNFHRRFDPVHRRAASLVRSGPPPVRLDLRYSGTLRNYGPHAFDLFRWLVGDPVRVAAVATGAGEPVVVLVAATGAEGVFRRIACDRLDLFECDIFTGDGRITLAALGERLHVGQARPSELWTDTVVLDVGMPEPELGLAGAMLGGVESLVAHLEQGSRLACDGGDGVAALRIVEAVERASREGVAVSVAGV